LRERAKDDDLEERDGLMRAELLGIRVFGRHADGGGGLFDVVEIPFRPGLTAIAGPNGVGKSRLLRAVKIALGGRSLDSGTDLVRYEVHFRLNKSDAGLRAIEQHVAAILRDAPLRRRDDTTGNWEEDLPIAVAASVDYHFEELTGLFARAMTDLCAAPCLAYVHESYSGQTTLALALDRTAEAPALRAIGSYLDDLWRETSRDLDESEDDDYTIMYDPFPGAGAFFEVAAGDADPFDRSRLPIPLINLADASYTPSVRYDEHKYAWPIEALDLDVDTDVQERTRSLLRRFDTHGDIEKLGLPDEAEFGAGRHRHLSRVLNQLIAAERLLTQAPERFPANVSQLAAAISMSATQRYRELTGQSLILHCDLRGVSRWLADEPFSWTAFDTPTLTRISLDNLSDHQRRWATVSIYVAIRTITELWFKGTSLATSILVMDEPEAGTHRAGESLLAAGLRTLSTETTAGIFVSTHTPKIVKSAHHTLVVSRTSGGAVQANDLDPDAEKVVEALGLDIDDVLGWYSKILFVEGTHDEAVLDVLLHDEIARTRTLMIPLRGLKQRSQVADAKLLSVTTVPALFLIDGLGASASAGWEQVRLKAASGGADSAKALARKLFHGGELEARFLREVAPILADKHAFDRFQVAALTTSDICELLPANTGCSITSDPSLFMREASGQLRRSSTRSRMISMQSSPSSIHRHCHQPDDVASTKTSSKS
jgi:hypothetical protein